MMNKAMVILLLAALGVSLFTACSSQKDEPPQEGAYADFAGKRIGVQTGEIYYLVANDILNAGEVPEYTLITDLLESLYLGRLDAVLTDSSYIQPLIDSGAYPDFDYIWIPKEVFTNESSVVFHTEELRDQFNAWLAGIIADGTMAEIQERWLGSSLPKDEDVPKFESSGENGVLRICDTGNFPPFTYFDANGQPTGLDYEVASRFAQHMGMTLDITMMAFEAIGPYVISGKADMSACYLTITEDRGRSMIFGDPVVSTQGVLIVPKSETSVNSARDYTDFAGKEIAAVVGAIHYLTIEKIGGIPIYYNDAPEAAEDVRRGRVEGFMTPLSNARVMAVQLDGFEVLPVPTEFFSAEVGGISNDPDVIDRFNVFLASIKRDGTFADMQNRWFGEGLDLDAPMPEIDNSGENGVLRVATSALSLPYVYVGANGEIKGFSAELALRFGAYEGKNVEFAEMDFNALIPYILSGRAELSLSSMAITEERKQSVLFTDSIHEEQHAILVREQSDVMAVDDHSYVEAGPMTSGTGSGFIERLKISIERNLITDNRWKMIVDGLGVTMTIAVLAQIFGTVFGAFICLLLTRKNRVINWCGRFYCGLIHGTPVVVLLMITYYIIFGNTQISNVLIAVAAFTMVTGAGVGGKLKGAIDTIDPVEIEAARSIGFSAFKAFTTVTLPQAIKRALPGYTNGFVELVKATAIVGYIAIQDLTRAGDIIRSRTYDAYFPLLFVALIYLIVTTICVYLFSLIVKKVNGKAGL